MCVEIAEGRDLDVLEIDAATHTGVDNVRDVIIDGLAIRPVRDRYKIFIIDEVHQLSNSSFNALLKSMEEPPPHVVFMMATTELHKIPDTILSRAQVFELRTIGTRAIADQLRRIAEAEGVTVDDEALALVARAAEGSMRDAQSALDQVLAFGSTSIDASRCRWCSGWSRAICSSTCSTSSRARTRRAVFDVAGPPGRIGARPAARLPRAGAAGARPDGAAGRSARGPLPTRTSRSKATASGCDALAAAFSREDLLRAFDLIAKLEADVRFATQPRYHLEMALLRWVHLRKLVPIAELIEAVEKNAPLPRGPAPARSVAARVPPARRHRPAHAAGSRPAPPSSRAVIIVVVDVVARLEARTARRRASGRAAVIAGVRAGVREAIRAARPAPRRLRPRIRVDRACTGGAASAAPASGRRRHRRQRRRSRPDPRCRRRAA